VGIVPWASPHSHMENKFHGLRDDNSPMSFNSNPMIVQAIIDNCRKLYHNKSITIEANLRLRQNQCWSIINLGIANLLVGY
jgi:hypothetical protein